MEAEEKAKLHRQALTSFDNCYSAEEEQRKLCKEEFDFINEPDGQWAKLKSSMKDKPMMTVDRISPLIKQVVGDQKQSKTDIKILPDGEGANKKYAEYLEGVIRGIESKSNAPDVYSGEFEKGLTGGIGGWRVYSKYIEGTFDQELAIKPVYSAVTSLWFDPIAKEYTKQDARYAFVVESMSESSFKDKYPNASLSGFDNNDTSFWYKRNELEDEIKVAEYWRKVKKKRQLVLFNDNRAFIKGAQDEFIDRHLSSGLRIVKEREEEYDCVKMHIISGSEMLTDEYEWPTPLFPLIPYYANYNYTNGKSYYMGMVRKGRDPQVMLNLHVSAMLEALMFSPADKVIMHESQVVADSLRNYHNPSETALLYTGNHPVAPTRSGPPVVQQQALVAIESAINDIHATVGIEPASAGRTPHANESGRALLAQQSMGDRGTYSMFDNLHLSIKHTGLILKQAYPFFYDTDREVEAIGNDGEPKSVNTRDYKQYAKGKYSVVCSSGASHTTMRRETVDQLVNLMNQTGMNEPMRMAMFDILVSNLDINKGDVLTERIRKILIGQGLVEPTEEEVEKFGLNDQQQPSSMDQAMEQNIVLDTAEKAANVAHIEAKTRTEIQKANQVAVDSMSKLLSESRDVIKNGGVVTDEMLIAIGNQAALLNSFQMNMVNASQN